MSDFDAPIPPVSSRHAPKFADADHRNRSAQAFTHGADVYHDVRPNYPTEILNLLSGGVHVCDVGAGTGKLTKQLVDDPRFTQVYACDPSAQMLHVLRNVVKIPLWQATAEHTAAVTGFFDVLTCAQTWHWVDPQAASAEFARITTNNAKVLLVWNTLDVSISWVHRLSRIMHSGDTLAKGFYPTFAPPWELTQELRLSWQQSLSIAEIIQLARTRSYWLRSNEHIRAKVEANLHWYLAEHLEFDANSAIQLPYRCDAFLLTKAP